MEKNGPCELGLLNGATTPPWGLGDVGYVRASPASSRRQRVHRMIDLVESEVTLQY